MSRSWSIRRRELFTGFIEQDIMQRSLQRLLAVTSRTWNLPCAAFAMPAPASGSGAGRPRLGSALQRV
ncbi:hypothetical protein HHL11_09865 [Ramlibacter sp. G-1-2-2]|uniref:Uncharacterized protein n=1 Tax=Ramlibacter agri TaxID=2728837 RepID=A0A848H0F4_9BURK|nr:hypothetical protein [Ramlibacter agri]NML44054.1 hypothetical protein [Ramlibacter agri]